MLHWFEYSMMSTTSTTLVFGLVFLFLGRQNGSSLYMIQWGVCWIFYSIMFFLDYSNLTGLYTISLYIPIRQTLTLLSALLFLVGTLDFFLLKSPAFLKWITGISFLTILFSILPYSFFGYILIPNIMYSTILLIWAGYLFISYSWTQNLPEKYIASFLILLWATYSNHFGFSLEYTMIATFNYFIGLFMVNLLIVFLMIIHFKKTRFLMGKREERFRLLVENSSDSMFLYDYAKHTFKYISPTVQKLLGHSTAELYRMPFKFYSNIDAANADKIRSILTLPITSPSMITFAVLKDSLINKWCEMHYLPIFDSMGTTVAVEGILRDITEIKKTEESLKDSENARKELIENISHELRTPITLIQGYLESMMNNVVPAGSQQLYLKILHSKTLLLNTMLEDLIQISHYTSQTLSYKFYELEAYSYFDSLLSQTEPHVVKSGKHFHSINRLQRNTTIIIDPSRIEQVIMNVINNSIKYTPYGGSITVECWDFINEEVTESKDSNEDLLNIPRGEITISVTDTGEGIPEEDLIHIFERRYQGKNSIQIESSRGSGLGLFISQQIINQHSGRIWAQNSSVGGAQLVFTIPYYRD